MTSEKLHANKEIISRFISAITCDWSNSSKEVGLFEIRCLGQKRTTKPKRFSLDTIDEAVDFAISMNGQKLNIYMTINPIDINASIKAGSGATDTDICGRITVSQTPTTKLVSQALSSSVSCVSQILS